MIVSCRIFKLEKVYPLKELQKKLRKKGIIEKVRFKTNGRILKLLTFIDDVIMKENDLHGSVSYESPLPILQADGTIEWVKEAIKVKFVFAPFGNSIFFIPFGSNAESAATKMNNAIFKADTILKQAFSSDMIERFLSQNPHIWKSGRWAGLNIPGISKAALAGADLLRSPDSRRYDVHGHKSFALVTLKENGWTIGLSQKGVVVFYSEVSKEEILQFVKSKIFSLL